MVQKFEDEGDSSFAGSIGKDDLQTINVAAKEITQPLVPFFDWLNIITSKEKGKSFFGWLNDLEETADKIKQNKFIK